ncbi:ATP-binding protein [Kitasatospora sp. NPDC059571]|uniref:ATP-binding protein n=1 Tax=Kitasatospora sp. NPDC059571 TaxID=3346871 RepID=UPI0036B35F4A
MLPLTNEIDVQGRGDAAREARDRVVRMLQDWRLPLSEEILQAVRLCTSELVANAVEHGGGTCRVRASWTGSHLRVDVIDTSSNAPETGCPTWDAIRGRGMLLVESLATTWGWEPRGDGKTVYALFALDTSTGPGAQSAPAPVLAAG